MTLILEEAAAVSFEFDYKILAQKVIEEAIREENFPYEAEVSLLLVSAEEIHTINLEHRQIDAPTDVLSFPLIAYQETFHILRKMKIILILILVRRCWVILFYAQTK